MAEKVTNNGGISQMNIGNRQSENVIRRQFVHVIRLFPSLS